ncbi:MAG: hypothetical protein EOO42_12625, partial [Flavobacteriales bacterium]
MTINTNKSSSRYGLIVILILALFISAIFFYTRNNRINLLSDNVSQLNHLESEYSLLDTCVLVLYKADNNCRLFEATGNNVYIKQFSKEISRVSVILDSLKIKENSKDYSQNVKGLVEQKKLKMQTYLKLRQLTDSLFSVNENIDTVTERTLLKGTEFLKSKLRNTVVIDTIKRNDEVKEKNLIGRLADAFSRKKKDTTATLVKKEITEDSSTSQSDYN